MKYIQSFLVFLCLGLDLTVAADYPNESEVGKKGHFGGTKPIQYAIDMEVIDKHLFKSNITIKLEVVEATKRILLNVESEYLKLNMSNDPIVKNQAGTIVPVEKMIFLDSMVLEIKLKHELAMKNQYTLSFFNFSGKIDFTRPHSLKWTYDTRRVKTKRERTGHKFVREGEVTRKLVLDVDNSVSNEIFNRWNDHDKIVWRYARRVIPCYDHPALKSVFKLSITNSATIKVFSNTPMSQVQFIPGTNNQVTRTMFEPTPIMSTYLFSFVVGLGVSSATELIDLANRKINFQIICQRSDVGEGGQDCPQVYFDRLKNNTVQYMTQMEAWTGVQYPMSLLSFVITPTYPYNIYAMENFGIISMLERFTSDPKIIAHEIIHQWFGNLVTARDWTQVCLQEGITFYLSSLLTNESEKRMRRLMAYINRLSAVKPLIGPMQTTQDVIDVCYHKPTAIFAMLENNFGNKSTHSLTIHFMRKLLSRFLYTSSTLDGWKTVMQEINGDAADVLHSYYSNIGYPIFIGSQLPNGSVQVKQYDNYGDVLETPFVIPLQYRDNLNRKYIGVIKDQTSILPVTPTLLTQKLQYFSLQRDDVFWGIAVEDWQTYWNMANSACAQIDSQCEYFSKEIIMDELKAIQRVPDSIYPLKKDKIRDKWFQLMCKYKSLDPSIDSWYYTSFPMVSLDEYDNCTTLSSIID